MNPAPFLGTLQGTEGGESRELALQRCSAQTEQPLDLPGVWPFVRADQEVPEDACRRWWYSQRLKRVRRKCCPSRRWLIGDRNLCCASLHDLDIRAI